MSITLGVHVGDDEISAVLIEVDLPELGPIAVRKVPIASVESGVGDAVATMLGIMRVQAAQSDVLIAGSAVACDNLLQAEMVRAALAAHLIYDVEVVDAADPRLGDDYPLDIAAAMIGPAATAWAGDSEAEEAAVGGQGWRRFGGDSAAGPRSARLTMVGLGVAVLAALSGATVWALTATGPASDGVVDAADTSEASSSDGDATSAPAVVVVADSASALPGPSSVPPLDAGPAYGPVSVGNWSKAPVAGPLVGATTAAEVSSGGGNSGGGNSGGGRPGGGNPGGGRPGCVIGGGGNPGTGTPATGNPATGNPATGNPGGGTTGNPGGGTPGGGNPGTDDPGTDDPGIENPGGDGSGGDGSGGDGSGGEETETEDPSTEPTTTTEAPETTERTSTEPS